MADTFNSGKTRFILALAKQCNCGWYGPQRKRAIISIHDIKRLVFNQDGVCLLHGTS